jgi:hypothetical protein
MGVEVILDQGDVLSLGELLSQVEHEVGVLFGTTFVVYLDPTSSGVGFKSQHHTTATMFGVLVILALTFPFAHGDGLEYIANQETGSLIKTDYRVLRVVGQAVGMEYLLHLG